MQKKVKTILAIALLLAAVFMLLTIPVQNATGATLKVGASETYTTIGAAIAAATDGDTIEVEAGTYAEELDLTGLGFAALTIRGTGVVTLAAGAGNTAILNPAGGVTTLTLVNLTVTSDTATINSDLAVTCENCTINYAISLGTGIISDFQWAGVTVYYLGGIDPVMGADVEWMDDGVAVYQTPGYSSGTDLLTDADGMVGPFLVHNADFVGGVAAWVDSAVSAKKTEAIMNEDTTYFVDTNATTMVDITFAFDMRAPDQLENVTVHTVDTTSLNITWNATNEVSFLNYSVIQVDDEIGTNPVLVGNTTELFYVHTGLTPDTQYFYAVSVVDDAELVSQFAFANGTTAALPPLPVVSGKVTYYGGPKDGMNATGAGVDLINTTAVKVSLVSDATTGNYTFVDVPAKLNYTIMVVPAAADAGEMGGKSGYLGNTTGAFDVAGDLTKNVVLSWYEFVPTLSGYVTYTGGPKAGTNATELDVTLYHNVAVYDNVTNTTSMVATLIETVETNNITGYFEFMAPIEMNYTLMVAPKAADLGVMAVKSGYLPVTSAYFDVDDNMEKNLTLTYYTYVEWAKVMGQVTYSGGDMDTMNGTELTVDLYQTLMELVDTNWTENKTKVATMTTNNVTGMYTFATIPGINYTVMVSPLAADAYEDGVQSGYLSIESALFDLVDKEENVLNLTLLWKEYIPPNPILTVVVTYKDGPMAGEFAINATLKVGSESPVILNATGTYAFQMAENWNLSIMVTPENAGVTGSKSGYMVYTTAINFTADKTQTVELVYYTYTPTVTATITVNTVEDKDYTAGDKLTITGTSTDLASGTVVTATIDGEPYTGTIGADGTWSIELTLPDKKGDYQVSVSAGTASTDFYVTVVEKDEGVNMMLVAGIIIAILAIIIIIVIVVFAMKKKAPEEEEEGEEDEEGEEGEEGEDAEDEDAEEGEESEDEDAEEGEESEEE